MKRLDSPFLLAFNVQAQAKDVSCPVLVDAKADGRPALERSKINHRPVLIFFEAYWREDCRALVASLRQPQNAALMKRDFSVMKVNVGNSIAAST